MLNLESKNNCTPEKGWWLNEPASDRMAFGIVLHQVDGIWIVARTLIGSPAEKAGVLKGEQFLSVDGYDVDVGKGDMYELQILMQLDTSNLHHVTFRTASANLTREIEKTTLRTLLEFDYDNGGAIRGYCYGCRTCRSVTIGATGCSSGCPGDYCTVG